MSRASEPPANPKHGISKLKLPVMDMLAWKEKRVVVF